MKYNDWTRGTITDAAPDTTNRRSQFLRTSGTGASSTGVSAQGIGRLTLGDSRPEDRMALGGSGDDGLIHFQGAVGGSTYGYAGIYSNTDLGGLLPSSSTDLEWKGILGISSRGIKYSDDFTLTVASNGNGGNISATVSNLSWTNNSIIIDATFDAQGVINGTLGGSILRGLIGSDGAVAVFISRGDAGGFVAAPDEAPVVTPPTPPTPTAKANYAAWRDSFTPPLPPISTANRRNQFLQTTNKDIDTGTASVFNRERLNLSTAEFGNAEVGTSPIGGDPDVGIVFDRTRSGDTTYNYVGIFEDADLGAPLTPTNETLTWNGAANLNGLPSYVTFTITFNGMEGMIKGFSENIRNGRDLLIEGTFDTGGVITGDVHHAVFADKENPILPATPNGVLSGIIGEEGTVGVFVSGTTTDGGVTITGGTIMGDISNDNSYVGGFVAAPNVEALAIVTESRWDASFPSSQLGRGVSSNNQFTQFNAGDTFLANGEIYSAKDISRNTKLIPTNLNMRDATFNNIPLGGDMADAVAFGSGFNIPSGISSDMISDRSFFAGINGAINLGKELPTWRSGQDVMAMWKGRFAAQRGDGTGTGNTTNTDFDLEVNFENRQVEAFVPVASGSITHYHLKGSFAANLNGAIRGTVDRRDFTNSNRLQGTGINVPGVFTGLIGEEGAVGVFISGARTGYSATLTTGGRGDTGYVGGFVACPYDTTNNRCERP